MITTIPRRFVLVMTGAIAIHAALSAVLVVARGYEGPMTVLAVALFTAAFLLLAVGTGEGQANLRTTFVSTTVAMALPLLRSTPLDAASATFTNGGWFVEAVAALVILLLWRQREPFAWLASFALIAGTFMWGGLHALNAMSVIAAVLLVSLVAAGGWSLRWAARVLAAHTEVEQRALAYQAAQDAFHFEREVRLATTARLGDAMLERIIERGGHLDPADRAECRVLEQTIRDEIRGRRLLNDAVREAVIVHRRRGATVQINDDGGLDDIEPEHVDPMLTRVAEAISGLRSDRIVIRTAPRDSTTAITVAAMSVDPMAAALGLDDGDDHVDLWLELELPTSR